MKICVTRLTSKNYILRFMCNIIAGYDILIVTLETRYRRGLNSYFLPRI